MEQYQNIDRVETMNMIRHNGEIKTVEYSIFDAPVGNVEGTFTISEEVGTFQTLEDHMVVVTFGDGETYIAHYGSGSSPYWRCSKNGLKYIGDHWYKAIAHAYWSKEDWK